jgi:hypothetical protein
LKPDFFEKTIVKPNKIQKIEIKENIDYVPNHTPLSKIKYLKSIFNTFKKNFVFEFEIYS